MSAGEPRTVLEFLTRATDWLAAKGVGEARLDAELLLAEAMGAERIALYTSFEKPLGPEEIVRYRELLRRRGLREPTAYILGRREFWSLDLAVDRRVLVPRPETELVVERVCELLADMEGEPLVADVGTGSGAIALAVAREIDKARVIATDASGAALEIAPGNAASLGLEDRVEFLGGDLLEPLAGRGPFDAIASNPPYVRSEDYESLEPEVRDWEPRSALVADDDGSELLLRLVDGAPALLGAEGVLVVEVGHQAERIAEAMRQAAWRDVAIRRDLAGCARVVEGRRPAGAGEV